MQTASQMMAAKKAAKQNKREARNFNLVSREQQGKLPQDRNRAANIGNARKHYLRRLLDTPAIGEDHYLNCAIIMWLNAKEMRYRNNPELVHFARGIVRQYRLLSAIYGASASAACDLADDGLMKWLANFDEYSPNQRDTALQPLWHIYGCMERALPQMPLGIFEHIGRYSCAVQVAYGTLEFTESNPAAVSALKEVVFGANAFQTAKAYGIPYKKLYADMIQTAQLILPAARETDPDTEWPENISGLRQDGYRRILADNGSGLIALCRQAENLIRQFENRVGIGLFKWASYTRRMQALVKTVPVS